MTDLFAHGGPVVYSDNQNAICRLLAAHPERSLPMADLQQMLGVNPGAIHCACQNLQARRVAVISGADGVRLDLQPFTALRCELVEPAAADWVIPCKVCGGPTQPLWHGWRRCSQCGSDTNPQTYAEVKHHYNADYLNHILKQFGGCRNKTIDSMRTNLELLNREHVPARTFLDIGANDACAMIGMERMGWAVWGFDVCPQAEYGEKIEVADRFTADLFDQQFGAVMCRETIEHVEDWRSLLTEAYKATLPGGVFQVQTPKPTQEPYEIGYQIEQPRVHLQLFSPSQLRRAIEAAGFRVIHHLGWDIGQCWTCRRD